MILYFKHFHVRLYILISQMFRTCQWGELACQWFWSLIYPKHQNFTHQSFGFRFLPYSPTKTNPFIYYLKMKIDELGPAFSTRSNLARARARGAGPPRTVEHRYLPDLGRYRNLVMRAME